MNDMDYWSELRARATSTEADPTTVTHALDAEKVADIAEADQVSHDEEDDGAEIQGIPDDAQISEERRIGFGASKDDTGNGTGKTLDKGKGKA